MTQPTRFRFLASACLLCTLQAVIGAEPKVRVSLATKDEIWVGQRVVLAVDLWAPGTFASAPSFDLPSVSGVIIIPPTGSPVLGSETTDDVSFTTQRHEIAIYPQRAGQISIPAFGIRFDSTPAFGQPTISNRLQTSPAEFKAQMPPGAQGLSVMITTSSLKVKQDWSPTLEGVQAKPGAAFARTITIEADNVPAMVLPTIHFTAPEGIRVYPQATTIDDRSDRGQSAGRRVEKATYVCERPGEYYVPALSFVWWDAEAKELHREIVTGASWTVLPAEPVAESVSNADAAKSTPRAVVIAAVTCLALLLAMTVVAILRRIRSRFNNDAERTWFTEFELQCRRGNAAETLCALRHWIAQVRPQHGELNPEEFQSLPVDPRLTTQINALRADVYGRPGNASQWAPHQLLTLARTERNKLLMQPRQALSDATSLPPLNPISE